MRIGRMARNLQVREGFKLFKSFEEVFPSHILSAPWSLNPGPKNTCGALNLCMWLELYIVSMACVRVQADFSRNPFFHEDSKQTVLGRHYQ